jgi:ubiquinone/menaquinone biosynthesis C-methylase UbiE
MSAEQAPIAEVDLRARHEGAHGTAVQAMFDRIAPTYDKLNHLMSAGIDRRWRARAVRELRGAPRGAILDLCAGTMDLTALVAREFPRERVIAADFAAQMLAAGKHKAPRAEAIVADAMALRFATARSPRSSADSASATSPTPRARSAKRGACSSRAGPS